MKNFQKILVCGLAVATLGCVSLIPMKAEAIIPIGDSSKQDYEWWAERAVAEAIIIVDVNNDFDGTYYYKNTENNGFPIKIDDDFDTTGIDATVIYHEEETILNVGEDTITYYAGIIIDNGYYYTRMGLDYDFGWLIEEIMIPKKDTTPITEFTVGESTYPRGDINLDGKVSTLDLLMLKKYLLGLMEW